MKGVNKLNEIIYVHELAKKIGLDDILVFRPSGKQAKEIIFERINCANSGIVIEINFKNIKSCDVSFVDEIIIEVQKYIINRDKLICITEVERQEIIENLEAALAFRYRKKKDNVQVLQKVQNNYSILGKIEENLKDTFELLTKSISITARDVAEAFGIEINSASNRLKKLFNLGLVLRDEIVDTSGRLHNYYLPR